MDRTPVTNAQFERFVAATGYVTVAERPLKPSDYPGVPADKLVPGSAVFQPTGNAGAARQPAAAGGATCRARLEASRRARQSSLDGKADHPVVHVAFEDVAGVREVGGQAAADRSGVRVRRARRPRPQALLVGQRHAARRQARVQHLAGTFPARDAASDGYTGDVAGDGVSRRTASASTTWAATSGSGAPIGIAPDYYAAFAAGTVGRGPARPGSKLRSRRTRRRQALSPRRLVFVHRRVLRALPGRQPRQGRDLERCVESGIPARPRCEAVRRPPRCPDRSSCSPSRRRPMLIVRGCSMPRGRCSPRIRR